MTDVSDNRRPFAERLRAAVEETATTGTRRPDGPRHRRRLSEPLFASVANPSRVRYSDELFVDRLRKAMD